VGQSVGYSADPIEQALSRALDEATKVGRWEVVGQLAGELQARRLARAGNVVAMPVLKRRSHHRQG
jgi:hypothetical protein